MFLVQFRRLASVNVAYVVKTSLKVKPVHTGNIVLDGYQHEAWKSSLLALIVG